MTRNCPLTINTLLNAISKLFPRTLCLTDWTTDNYILTEAQFGFRPSYSTTYTCFTLYSMINHIKSNHTMYCDFVDFTTAFDSVSRQMLFTRLLECGISSKMLNIIMALHSNVTSCVKLKNCTYDVLVCENGLHQGDSYLSPILFSFYIYDLPIVLSQSEISSDV